MGSLAAFPTWCHFTKMGNCSILYTLRLKAQQGSWGSNPDTQAWVLGDDAPASARSDGPLYVDGPIWRMELAIPAVWPDSKTAALRNSAATVSCNAEFGLFPGVADEFGLTV